MHLQIEAPSFDLGAVRISRPVLEGMQTSEELFGFVSRCVSNHGQKRWGLATEMFGESNVLSLSGGYGGCGMVFSAHCDRVQMSVVSLWIVTEMELKATSVHYPGTGVGTRIMKFLSGEKIACPQESPLDIKKDVKTKSGPARRRSSRSMVVGRSGGKESEERDG